MKIALVMFGEISDEASRLHLNHLNNVLYQGFKSEFKELSCFCLECDNNITANSFVKSWFNKRRIITQKMSGKKRNYEDLISDFETWVSARLRRKEYDFIFMTRSLNLQLDEKVATGGIVVTFPFDYIDRVLEKERISYNYQEESYYSNQERIAKQKHILNSWNFMVPGTPSELSRRIFSSSYAHYVHPSSIYEAPDTFKLSVTPSSDEVVFVTTTHENSLKKGVTQVLEAWKVFQDRNPKLKTRLNVVGRLNDQLKALYNQIETRNVHYLGQQKNIQNIYAQSHFLVCGSLIELGPRTIRQALKMGLPVIASNQCGMADQIGSEEGYVFALNAPDRLANIFEQAIGADWNKMSIACQKKANSFSTESYVNEIIHEIKQRFD